MRHYPELSNCPIIHPQDCDPVWTIPFIQKKPFKNIVQTRVLSAALPTPLHRLVLLCIDDTEFISLPGICTGDVLAAPESALGLDRCNISLSLSLDVISLYLSISHQPNTLLWSLAGDVRWQFHLIFSPVLDGEKVCSLSLIVLCSQFLAGYGACKFLHRITNHGWAGIRFD